MAQPTQCESYKFSEDDYKGFSAVEALEVFRDSLDVTIHGLDDDGADMKIILWDADATEEVMIVKLMELIDEYVAHGEFDDVPDVLKERAEHLTKVADRIRSAANRLLSEAAALPEVVTSAAVQPAPAIEKSTQN